MKYFIGTVMVRRPIIDAVRTIILDRLSDIWLCKSCYATDMNL